MFGLFLGFLIALVSAQIIYAPPNPVNINGPDVATRVQLLPGGGFRLFDAEDADNIFYPTTSQRPPSRVIYMDAHDLGNDYNPPIGFIPYRPRPTPVHPVIFSAEDAENGGVNWGEITKIAGQINEIGHILGFDADDTDNSITVGTACAIIGAACALANTGMNIYGHIKSSDEDEDLTNGGINWGEITKIAGQIHDIGKTLGFAAEDLEDKTHWSVTVGNADEVENGGVNWSEITKIAGQINEIDHILGYDTKEDDILSLPKFGRGLIMPRSLLPHGRRTKSTKGNRLLKAHNHSTKASDLTNGYHTRCPACFAAEDANNWTVKPYSPAKPLFPRPKPAIW